MIEFIERASPLLLFFVLLYQSKMSTDKLLVPVIYLTNDYFGYILKEFIFKTIMTDKTYPIIGAGMRPKGAKSCGLFATGKPATSYGMPSGHANSIAFFLIYQLAAVRHSPISQIMLIMVCLYLIYSRVKLGCHTWQQILIGSIIGGINGYGAYVFLGRKKFA